MIWVQLDIIGSSFVAFYIYFANFGNALKMKKHYKHCKYANIVDDRLYGISFKQIGSGISLWCVQIHKSICVNIAIMQACWWYSKK